MANQKFKQFFTITSRFFSRYTVVVAAFLIMLLSWGIYYSFGIFLKPILLEFGWTRAMTTGAFSFSWLVAGFVGIFMGGLTDRFGPRIVLTICGLLAGSGYLLMSQINSFWQLYLFYGVLIGAGTSTFTPLMSTIARLYAQKRTIMSGIVTVGIGIGSLIIPPLANQIILAYDWRASFIALGLVIFVFFILSAQLLTRNASITERTTSTKNKTTKEKTISDVRVFTFNDAVRTRQFWIIFTMFFCMGFCVLTAQVHIVPYATDINISTTTAANILAIIGGSSIIGRIALGALGDKIGNRRAFVIGFILMALPLLCLVFFREIWMLFLIAFILGLGYGDCVASESPIVAAVFGLRSHGLIFGFLANAFSIGAAVGPFAAGYIFDVTGSYQLAFSLAAGIGILGLAVTLVLPQLKNKQA
jgi:MFS family permease